MKKVQDKWDELTLKQAWQAIDALERQVNDIERLRHEMHLQIREQARQFTDLMMLIVPAEGDGQREQARQFTDLMKWSLR